MVYLGAKLQYEAAKKYYKGVSNQGYSRNYKKAFFLCQEASEAGLSEAMVLLAKMYENGHGCKRNIKEAIMWLKKAADLGNVDAQYEVGCIYSFGRYNTRMNESLGCEYFEKAAKQGHEKSMYYVAEYYYRNKQYEKASAYLSLNVLQQQGYMLYLRAKVEHEWEQEKYYKQIHDALIEVILKEGYDAFEEKMENAIATYQPSDKVFCFYQKALQMFEQEASLGNVVSAYMAGNMYYNGEGSKVNIQKALHYYEHISENREAQYDFYRNAAEKKIKEIRKIRS